MKRGKVTAAAGPTALVAAAARAGATGRSRRHRRSGLRLAGPAGPATTLKRLSTRRRRRRMIMSLARHAGTVVTAASFAAEVANQMREAGEDHRGGRR